MPFSGASDPKLPSNVADRSLAVRRQWVGAWNGRFEDCRSDGGSTSDCESSAFAVANAAIKEHDVVTIPTDNDTEETVVVQPGDKFHEAPEYWDFRERRMDQKSANYNPVGGTGEKACSNCQWFIAPAACQVVDGYPDPIVPNGLSDLWLARVDRSAQIEPLEVVVVGEREAEVGDKAETKTEGGVAYPAADFAVIPDASKPSGWKLRLAEGSAGNVTVAQVARAITAMQPGGFRGNRVSLTSDQKAQAISRISGAIGRSGGDNDQKADLRERLDAVKARANWWEVVVTGPQALKALAAKQLDALMSLRGIDEGESGDTFAYDSSLTLFKDADDNIRFMAIMSNRYRDRDEEIITGAAHRDFVDYLDRAAYKDIDGEPLMEAWLWHTPGTRWGAVDWADYFNGFMVVSGTVEKGFEHVAEALAADKDVGISHGFRYLTDDHDRSIITQYRSFEFSALPQSVASNPYTALAVIQEEVKAMSETKGISEEKRPFIAAKLGEEPTALIEADTAQADAALQAAGVDSKAASPPAIDPAAPPAGDAPITVEALAEASVKAISESKAFQDMAATVLANTKATADLIARVTAVEQSEDSKIAAQFASRVGNVADKRASESATNVIVETEAKKDGVPTFDIFREATAQVEEAAGLAPSG